MKILDYKPPSPVDWSAMTPNQIAAALRNIPRRIAYAWRLSRDGDWMRDDADDYGVAFAAIARHNEDGTWQGPPIQVIEKNAHGSENWNTRPSRPYATADAAKHDYDQFLRRNGWLIDDTDDGSGDGQPLDDRKKIVVNGETVEVTQYAWDEGTRVWVEVRRAPAPADPIAGYTTEELRERGER